MPADGGIKFGQYVLIRRIARGGMAEVFLAQQRGLEGFDRRVAVKRILPHLADTPDFVKMFLGEARLAAQLAHPNVVHIYDFGKVDNDYFIAMEYVDGVHAGQLFKTGEHRMPPTLVARVGADAAAALNYAHELRGTDGKPLGLVHRDVSPANIMVSYDGIVKLCDFGIAKAAAANSNLTNPGQVKGKYAYMSPEQTVASGLDGRSDVFSLGICLWELLVGKTIVPRGDAVEAMRMIRDGKLPSISQVAPQTPPPLAKAVQWALETKREKRATASELAQALEAFIKSSPELATPMQLAAFVRTRFPRDATGPVPALGDSPGTGVVGTAAAFGTMAAPGTAASMMTPSVETPIRPKALVAPARLPERTASIDNDLDLNETIAIESKLPDRSSQAFLVESEDPDAEPTLKPGQRPIIVPPPMANRPRPITRAPLPRPTSAPKAVSRTRNATEDEPTNDPDKEAPTHPRPSSGPRPLPTPTPRRDMPTGPRVFDRADEPTVRPDAPIVPVAEMGTLIAPRPQSGPRPGDSFDDLDANETIVSSGARRQPMSNPAAIPTMSVAPLPTYVDHQPIPDTTMAVRKRMPRGVVVGLALGGLALFTFVIVLAARSSGPTLPVAVVRDAGVVIDAETLTIDPMDDAAIDAPSDAAFTPTLAPDAPVATALLEVATQPEGGLVSVGDQRRTSPARLALPSGTYEILAELPGYENEKRTVELLAGEHVNKEIVFDKKVTRPSNKLETGKLTIRTTPYSEVFNGPKKIGEAPFADLVLPAGTYTLTFKNPTHPTTTKKVTIFGGKITKLSFALPL